MKRLFVLFICLCLLAGCVQVPKEALELPPESLANRQLQTRRFETTDKEQMLAAAANVLQDLGFTMEESETNLGILTGSKTRSAVSAAQVTGAILIAALGGGAMPVDKHQTIRVSMVMRKKPDVNESTVRVTFQRLIINTASQCTRAEQISDVEIYKEFFEKLSKSVFLEAHEI